MAGWEIYHFGIRGGGRGVCNEDGDEEEGG